MKKIIIIGILIGILFISGCEDKVEITSIEARPKVLAPEQNFDIVFSINNPFDFQGIIYWNLIYRKQCFTPVIPIKERSKLTISPGESFYYIKMQVKNGTRICPGTHDILFDIEDSQRLLDWESVEVEIAELAE